jgi:hypothetical protein
LVGDLGRVKLNQISQKMISGTSENKSVLQAIHYREKKTEKNYDLVFDHTYLND